MATEQSLFDQANQLAKDNQIAPTLNDFDESKGVEGRVQSITQQDSPLMQTAATKAAQSANARGLNSSTLGVQAGQQAVIETATPIANADANLYQQQSLANQAAKNNASIANANNSISAGMQGMGFDNSNLQQSKSLMESARQFDQNFVLQNRQLDAQIDQFAKNLGLTTQELQLKRDQLSSADQQALAQLEFQKSQLAQQQTQFAATQQQQMVLANLDADTRTQIAELQAANQKEISSSETLSNAWGTMMQSISNIQNNPNLDAAAKQTMIDNTIGSFKNYAEYYGKTNSVDVSGLLDFSAAPGAPAKTPAPAQAAPQAAPQQYMPQFDSTGP